MDHRRPKASNLVLPEKLISIIGTGAADAEACELAHATGRLVAEHGYGIITGGLGGVMEAASRGAVEAGGRTLGILPGRDPADANPWVQIAIPTGLGDARNAIVATAGIGAIAIGGAGIWIAPLLPLLTLAA